MSQLKTLGARLIEGMKRKPWRKPDGVVLFAPNAWFPSMLSAPAIVAKTLAERGYSINVVSCAAERKTCTVMDGMAPLQERPARQFCDECTARSREYLSGYALNQRLDTEFLSEADRRRLDRMMAEIGPDPRTFVWEGIHIGVLAAGNLSAITKQDIFSEMSDELRVRLKIMVEDGLRWSIIAQNIYTELKPRYFIYYAEYYPEIIAGLVMKRFGVRVVPVVHATLCGNDFRKIQILDQMPQVLDMARRLPTWPQWRDLSLTPIQMHEVSNDVVTRLLGKSAICFSPGINQCDEFTQLVAKLDPNVKTIVAFTSSDDEINNTKMQRNMFGLPADTSGDIFVDQYTWLRDLASFVAASQEHQLIVRLHPRLGANRRSNGVADYSRQVEAVSGVACPRIHVVLPESTCSSYDIAQYADLVLTSWSSIGLECVRIGLPVMMTFQGLDIYPAGDFLNYTTHRDSYFQRVRDGLMIDLVDILQAYRYTNMHLCGIALDFADLIQRVDDPTLPIFKTPSCADELEDFVVGRDVVQHRRLSQQRAHQGTHASDYELAALAIAIRRAIYALAFGNDVTPERLLISSEPNLERHCLSLDIKGDDVKATYGVHTITLKSKAIRKLASFHTDIEQDVLRTQDARTGVSHKRIAEHAL